MLFNSFVFPVFFLIVYIIYRGSSHKLQNRLLLLASYVFYGSWDWRFLPLILLSTVVDYYCGLNIDKFSDTRRRKTYLHLSLLVNLGTLGVFKYFNFFSDNLQSLMSQFGLHLDGLTLDILLPVGISFYTFQTLSYTIDIYLNKSKPERNFLNFALFVSFFPQLVAGPIERSTRLLPQIQFPRKITAAKNKEGLWFIFWGYFLKIFVADNMAKISDRVFAETAPQSGGEALMGMYAFAFQIFGDFAGYSFIAIGVAKLLGFDLMTNFLFPYFVTNPTDFWKNWHISLSSWLRDYLYIPLGGNRNGSLMTYRNLFITMFLGGLWHGAAWTFVIWGIFHGVLLSLFRVLKPMTEKMKISSTYLLITYALKVVIMFHLTCLGWLIFRAESLQQIVAFLQAIIFNIGSMTDRLQYYVLFMIFHLWLLCLIQFIQKRKGDLMALENIQWCPSWIFYIMMLYSMLFWGEFGGQQFIYFQF